jgi:alkanesulfonate monooxygenase SsuD/methylene tetrahydromethanopterin reductase-like flavin-dependent oxidoreductase (luciferase family)
MKTALFCLFENWENDYQKAITDQISLVCYAEKLGFEEAWITEHHFNNFSVIPSPLTVASYLLGKTKKIKIGTAAILLPYYNPIQIAEELAVIKTFDKDRFLFGIAKGAFPIYDKTFKTNALTNREVMFEANELIHKLLKEDNITFNGKYFSCKDITIRPNAKREFETFIASQSVEAIKKAAENGYGLIGSLAICKYEVDNIVDLYNKLNPVKPLSFRLARGINIGYNKDEIMEEAQYCADIFLQSMIASKDTNPALVKLLTDSEYLDIRNKLFDKNKILENSICGTPKECIEQIKSLKESFNIETLLLKPLTKSSKRAKKVLELYVKEVKPYV